MNIQDYFDVEDAFWRKVDKGSDCWMWQGLVVKQGYGKHNIKRVQKSAHRIAWVLANRKPIPDTLFVLHSCDNRACCNPDHLRLGTHRDNMNDARLRGRMVASRSRGFDHYNSRLKAEDIVDIRSRFAAGDMMPTIMIDYDTTKTTVFNLIHGKTYPDVGGPICGKDYEIKGRRYKEIVWL